jgi:hypothetical protein
MLLMKIAEDNRVKIEKREKEEKERSNKKDV